MRLPGSARTRRLLVVLLMVALLSFPLVATLVTRSRVERSGVDVTATVLQTQRDGARYLVAFRLPKDVDPDQTRYSAEVERATYEKATQTEQVTVRVLEGRPKAHRVEGEIRPSTPYVITGGSIAIVLAIGLVWVKVGRRRPTVRLRALGPLEPAGTDEIGVLGRQPEGDVYEAVGTVVSTDEREVLLDLGERRVVVSLDGHDNPVDVGAPARARGPVIG